MNVKLLNAILLMAFGVLLFFGLSSYAPSLPTADTIRLSGEVAVAVNDIRYSVYPDGSIVARDTPPSNIGASDRQKILTLALFYDVTKNDPLLYSPHINVSGWKEVLPLLQKKRGEFFAALRAYPSSSISEQKIIKKIIAGPSSIYPFEFLEAFLAAVEAQERFLEYPSLELALKLIDTQQLAAEEYATNAKGFARITADATKTLPSGVYLTLGSAITTKLVSEDAALIAENARRLRLEIEERYRCLKFGSCGASRPRIHSVLAMSDDPVASSPYKIPIDIITPPRTTETLGPYAITTSCFGKSADGSPRRWPMYLFVSINDGIRTALPMLANENYYWDTRRSDYPSDVEKVALGVTYNDQAATNLYMCNNNDYYPNILTLVFLQNLIKKEGAVVPAEERLLYDPVPSDALFSELLTQYEGADNTITAERALVVENKLVGYELMLGKLAELFNSYSAITVINEYPFPVATILGLRSSYSLLYLPFARSVWRLPDQPRFFLEEQYTNADRYFTWDEVREQGFDPAQGRVWDSDLNQIILARLGKEDWQKKLSENSFSFLSKFLQSLH